MFSQCFPLSLSFLSVSLFVCNSCVCSSIVREKKKCVESDVFFRFARSFSFRFRFRNAFKIRIINAFLSLDILSFLSVSLSLSVILVYIVREKYKRNVLNQMYFFDSQGPSSFVFVFETRLKLESSFFFFG